MREMHEVSKKKGKCACGNSKHARYLICDLANILQYLMPFEVSNARTHIIGKSYS